MGDKCVQAVLREDDADDGARSCFRRASSFSASLVADWPTDRQIQTWTVNSLRISAATDNPRFQLLGGLVLGFFLGEQLVHYWCDRVLFRFRAPEIRKTVGVWALTATSSSSSSS